MCLTHQSPRELLPPEDGKISQKTEDLVGPYELHDFYLYHMLRLSYAPAKVYRLAKQAFAELMTMQRFLSGWRHFTAVSLRSSLNVPACRTDQKSEVLRYLLRGDLRMPSDACASIWLAELEELKDAVSQG